ncbi:uncharacterized protein LOC129583428 isoform X2 [Paramacrobiotus metropolitanus]|uniref:uncharacterized protein LOC129583428 isoform X2 n=1 Tax=Paramacrobiotus metropolitanus TaxID=2943436 RepID=UPI0024460BCC|nr:uncharacterized protein LOC129583428 isoform X2 [Paramacrobiotus metropolitanus]
MPAMNTTLSVSPHQSTIQNLRDLNYFGSDSFKHWKSGYKKDFRLYQENELESTGLNGLRKAAEVIIREPNGPASTTESRTAFVDQAPSVRDRNTVSHSKSVESNPKVFHEDTRLVDFETTSTQAFPALEIHPRKPVDKIAMLEQIKSFSLADRPVEKLTAKNVMEFPNYTHVSAGKTRFINLPRCGIENVFKEQPKSKFNATTTVTDTYPVYSAQDYSDAKGAAAVPNFTPKSALLPLTNESTGNTRSRADHRPFSLSQMLLAKSDPVKQQHRDLAELYHMDERLTDHTVTSHAEHVCYPGNVQMMDKNGKMDYKHKYGDIVGQDLKIEEKFLPKHLHQQSMTIDSFPRWSHEHYRRPKRNFGSFVSALPPGLENDPAVVTTEHRESMVPHSVDRTQAIRPPPSRIVDAIPFGAPMMTNETVFQQSYKQLPLPDQSRIHKNMQATSIVEAKHGLDYRTTAGTSFVPFSADPPHPFVPEKDRNPILNDGSSWRKLSPFYPELQDNV